MRWFGMCCSNLSQHRHWKKKCKLHASMHVAWFSDTDPVSGVKLDLRSGTSYSRSTTSNNKSCTSQLRSGTFLLGSTTLLGRIQASNTILSHKSQTECVECSKTPGRWQSLKNVQTDGRAWKMKIRAWKNQDPCFNFYKLIYALLHKYPV